MKKLFTLLTIFAFVQVSFGQSAGDIAIIAFNADGGDDFAFVALVDIAASTEIYFTDNEWNGTAFNDLNEGELKWTNAASTLSAGSVVVVTDPSTGASVNVGTISGSGYNYGGSNEWAYALDQAPATSYASTPTFYAAYANDAGSGWLTGTGLTEGTNAIDFNNDHDGFKYTGTRSGQANFSDYLSLIYNSSNWQDEASNGENILPISTTAFTTSGSNDNTTEVYAPGTQITGGTFSSLNDTQGEAVNVFKMTIEDQGSGDGLVTHVTNIRVKPHTTNTADWSDHIQGVTLANGGSITIGSPTITDNYIDIPISSGDLDIADGGSTDVTLAVYLNTSNIFDGATLSFMVDADNHGFTADASGSDFIGTFTLGDFNSNDFTIAVNATELQFSSVPSSVGTNQDFSATVSATDENGNTDTDDATSVTLSKKTGTGTLSSVTGLTQSLSSGTNTWSDLQFDTAGDFTVAANGGAYSEIVTGTITAENLVAPSNGDVFISEVADASSSSNEFLELYNNTSNKIDLSNTKIIRIKADGTYDSYTFDFSTDGTGDTRIPANGIIVIARGNDQASFETEWGALPSGVNFNEGNSNLYFGTGRQWAIKDGGTANTNDGTLIDETGEAVATSGNRSYQNPVGTWTTDERSNATPGELDGGQALPVELTSFTANVLDKAVVLDWQTATEVNNYGFEIQRASSSTTPRQDGWEKIGFVNGHGNSNSTKSYSFTDNSAVSGKYSYRLKQIDTDGKFEYSDVAEVTIGAPDKFELLQNYPNPFNPTTQISFALPLAAKVNLSVYNMLGQKVEELANRSFEAGVHSVQFNAASYSSGIYFYKLTAGNFLQIKKMMLLK